MLFRLWRVMLLVLAAVLWIGCGADDSGAPAASTLDASSVDASKGADATTSDAKSSSPTITSFIAAKSTLSTGGTTSLTAIFSGGSGTIDNGVGVVTSGVAVATDTLTATTTFTLTVTTADGQTTTQQLTVAVVAAPTITSFAAAKSPLTMGKATELMATFAGGTGTIDQGIGAITSGLGVATGALSASTTFTLTVINAAGDAVTATVSVDVVDAPAITSFVAARSPIGAGTATQLTATFTGGTGVLDHGLGAVTSGVAVSTGNLATDSTFTLTVTNVAGDSVTGNVTVSVVTGPFIASFAAASPKISRYSSTTLTAVFSGGTASIDQGIGAVTSGTPKATSNLPGKTTFTLRVTGPSGDSVTATTDVDVKREIFVTDGGEPPAIFVFDEDASGDVAPKRAITGPNTTLDMPMGVSVVGDELVAASLTRILTFNVTDDGDVAPKRTILAMPDVVFPPAALYDLVVSNGEIFTASANGDRVSVFNLDDSGSVPPKRVLSGTATLLDFSNGAAVDSGELFVANTNANLVTVHAATASGDVAPLRSHSIASPVGVLVNGDELVVARANAITTLNKTTFAAIREITGANTKLYYPKACAVVGSELACTLYANAYQHIMFWPISANGDVPPTRVIYGVATRLNDPFGIYVH